MDFEIKAKQFRFSTVNTGVISNEDVVEDFDEGTGDGTDNDPYDDDRAINPYLADANHITVAITDVGSGFAAGDTLIFTPDETSAGTPANTRNLAASFTLLGTSLQSALQIRLGENYARLYNNIKYTGSCRCAFNPAAYASSKR